MRQIVGCLVLSGLLVACQPASLPPAPPSPSAASLTPAAVPRDAPVTPVVATPTIAVPTPVPTSAPSRTPAQPTAQATAAPSATPAAPSPTTTAVVGVVFVSVVGGAPRGAASVTVQTMPGATCAISYVTPMGTRSAAQGLVPRAAGKEGRVSWSWIIGSATRPGAGSVTVTCNGVSAMAQIHIG